MFGLVICQKGRESGDWFSNSGPEILSDAFTLPLFHQYVKRKADWGVKKFLLDQAFFPGVGNWMADEILWQCGLNPAIKTGVLSEGEVSNLRCKTRVICRTALRRIGEKYDDVPKGWLFHERWSGKGICPIHSIPLEKTVVGGRTSAWCPKCQPFRTGPGMAVKKAV